jgi:hypothetical protein
VPAAGCEIGFVDVCAVRDRVWLLEALLGRLAQIDARDEAAGQRVAHLHPVRDPGIGQDGILEADLVQRPKDIRPELDAGAEFLEFGGLLQHPHRETLQRQRISRHQPADATADHQDRQVMSVSRHDRLPLPTQDRPQPATAGLLPASGCGIAILLVRQCRGRKVPEAQGGNVPASLRLVGLVDRTGLGRQPDGGDEIMAAGIANP